jgi:hypothetical protein
MFSYGPNPAGPLLFKRPGELLALPVSRAEDVPKSHFFRKPAMFIAASATTSGSRKPAICGLQIAW